MNINNLLVAVGIVVFIIYAVVNILYVIDMRKTAAAFRRFIIRTDENLQPALAELRITLQDVRKFTDSLASLQNRLLSITGTVMSVEKSIRTLYAYYREGFGQAALSNIGSLKAGLRAGMTSLFKKVRRR